jgi:hypothetical protein
MKGLTIAAVFGLVGYLLSYGILIPLGLEFFKILAAVGMMAGSAVGRHTADSVARPRFRAPLIIVAMLVCVGSAITYVLMEPMGSANTSDIVDLALLITVFFFCFAFLVPISGVSFDRV